MRGTSAQNQGGRRLQNAPKPGNDRKNRRKGADYRNAPPAVNRSVGFIVAWLNFNPSGRRWRRAWLRATSPASALRARTGGGPLEYLRPSRRPEWRLFRG